MGMNAGDNQATSGMSKSIYDTMIADGMNMNVIEGMDAIGKADLESGLKKMAYAIAKGVIDHLTSDAIIKTDLDSALRTIETYHLGVGDKGGSLTSVTGGTVSGSVKTDKSDSATGTIK